MADADAKGFKAGHGREVVPSYLEDLNLGKFVAETREAAFSAIGYRSSLERAAGAQAKPAGTSALEKFSNTFSSKARG